MRIALVDGKDGCGQMKPLIPFKTGQAVNQPKMNFMHVYIYQTLDGKESNHTVSNITSANMVINRIHLRSSGFWLCFTISFQANFRQSFRVSISIAAQCEQSLRKGHFHVRSLLHGVICIAMCQQAPNCPLFLLSSPGHLLVNNCSAIP